MHPGFVARPRSSLSSALKEAQMASPLTGSGRKRAADSKAPNQSALKKPRAEDGDADKLYLDVIGIEMVDIYVGEGDKQRHFRIHKDLLCSKVPYFKKMFKGGFKGARKNSASLPEDTPEAFDIIQQWVYTGRLRPLTCSERSDNTWHPNWYIEDLDTLLDKLCLPDLRDLALTAYINVNEADGLVPSLEALKEASSNAPERSMLRKYLAHCLHFIMGGLNKDDDLFIGDWEMAELKDCLVQNQDLLVDYLTLLKEHPNGEEVPDPRKMPRCFFHHHAEQEPCPVVAANSELGTNN